MTSVGYGDMFPYSDAGRAVGAIIMLSGILTLAVPITLISNKFNHVWLEAKTKKRKEQTIQHLITGSPTGEDDTKIEETADMMNSIDTRTATVKLLLKQSYQVSSDDRFLSAVHLLDTPGECLWSPCQFSHRFSHRFLHLFSVILAVASVSNGI